MAGSGIRFGGEVPKQFQLLLGRKVFSYALETLIETGFFEEIIVVCHPAWLHTETWPSSVKAVAGGDTRQESSFIGLQSFEKAPDIVLIHDAVRPFVSEEIIRNNLLGALSHGAVDTCIPSADTLVCSLDRSTICSIPVRETLLRGQTPQTFSYPLILEAHRHAVHEHIQGVSDDCRLVLEREKPVFLVEGSEENIKITTELDLKIAETLLATKSKTTSS